MRGKPMHMFPSFNKEGLGVVSATKFSPSCEGGLAIYYQNSPLEGSA